MISQQLDISPVLTLLLEAKKKLNKKFDKQAFLEEFQKDYAKLQQSARLQSKKEEFGAEDFYPILRRMLDENLTENHMVALCHICNHSFNNPDVIDESGLEMTFNIFRGEMLGIFCKKLFLKAANVTNDIQDSKLAHDFFAEIQQLPLSLFDIDNLSAIKSAIRGVLFDNYIQEHQGKLEAIVEATIRKTKASHLNELIFALATAEALELEDYQKQFRDEIKLRLKKITQVHAVIESLVNQITVLHKTNKLLKPKQIQEQLLQEDMAAFIKCRNDIISGQASAVDIATICLTKNYEKQAKEMFQDLRNADNLLNQMQTIMRKQVDKEFKMASKQPKKSPNTYIIAAKIELNAIHTEIEKQMHPQNKVNLSVIAAQISKFNINYEDLEKHVDFATNPIAQLLNKCYRSFKTLSQNLRSFRRNTQAIPAATQARLSNAEAPKLIMFSRCQKKMHKLKTQIGQSFSKYVAGL